MGVGPAGGIDRGTGLPAERRDGREDLLSRPEGIKLPPHPEGDLRAVDGTAGRPDVAVSAGAGPSEMYQGCGRGDGEKVSRGG